MSKEAPNDYSVRLIVCIPLLMLFSLCALLFPSLMRESILRFEKSLLFGNSMACRCKFLNAAITELNLIYDCTLQLIPSMNLIVQICINLCRFQTTQL